MLLLFERNYCLALGFLSVCRLLQTCSCDGASAIAKQNIVLVVFSQDVAHHVTLAEEFRRDVHSQASILGVDKPVVHLTHEDFPDRGAWTYFPTIRWLSEHHDTNSSWIFFCEDRTRIRLAELRALLSRFNPAEDVWIGHSLRDTEPSIIHHFSDAPSFKYPLIQLGFAMSTSLVNNLAQRLAQRGTRDADFSIDSSYELSLFVFDSGRGSPLTHSPLMCLVDQDHCASYYVPFKPCMKPVSNDVIHFAVKTCRKFHADRLPVVQQTWAEAANHIAFYSDYHDVSIPTLDLGVPNTERGHCGKTAAILGHVASSLPSVEWLVIADDDTLLSVSKLQALLSCYSSSEPVAIGERYGYNAGHRLGYNYVTGGGGIVLSMAAVQLLAETCRCPSSATPDDMYLGVCMLRLGIPVVHVPQFHQARPPDYAPELLSIERPISFHKHWMLDPLQVYREWFYESPSSVHHTEL